MNRKKAKVGVFIFSLFLGLNTFGEVRSEKIFDCKISFKTVGQPVLVSIEGKSENACEGSWTLNGTKVTESMISLDLNKLDTGIALRNRHLRENYLQTEKFPKAVLTEIEAEQMESQRNGTAKGPSPFKGILELHGEKKTVNGNYRILEKNQYSGEFKIDLPDFGIKRPAFMGVKVVDKVTITFKFKVN